MTRRKSAVVQKSSVACQQSTDGPEMEGADMKERFEEKMLELLDLATDKSAHTRTKALLLLAAKLQRSAGTEFPQYIHQALTDVVVRSLKKGQGMEYLAAARLSSLLMMVIMSLSKQVDEGELVYKVLSPLLRVTLADPSTPASVRKECAYTLSICTFIFAEACGDCVATVTEVMHTLRSVYKASLPKDNGDLPRHTAPVTALHTAALNGFCLLLSALPPAFVYIMADSVVQELSDLLGKSDVELRIQAGEGLALLYELARQHDQDFSWGEDYNQQEQLCETLRNLSTNFQKTLSKQDRRQQRASFRDILSTVEGYGGQTEKVMVGPCHDRQTLVLDTWALKVQYQAMCRVFGEGMLTHLTYNGMVRYVFSLGSPPLPLDPKSSYVQAQKKSAKSRLAAVSKVRQRERNINRDMKARRNTFDDEY